MTFGGRHDLAPGITMLSEDGDFNPHLETWINGCSSEVVLAQQG